MKPSNKCEYCNEVDFLEHFFVECKRLTGFWKHVTNFILQKIDVKIDPSVNQILCGIEHGEFPTVSTEKFNFINHVLLIAKMCVSKMRYGKCNYIFLLFELDISLRLTNNFLTLPI